MLSLFALSPRPAQASCLDWSKARGVISGNNLVTPGSVRKKAIRRGGEVISIKLCKNGQRYVYLLTVRGAKKNVDIVAVDAHNGRRLGSGNDIKNRVLNKVRRGLRKYGL